jgi:hypothetical protein
MSGVANTVCAIHQPNLFPRLSTLAKIFVADHWIVLDDVQFVRRDYQHRCRVRRPAEPTHEQWLSLPVHLPNGRSTLINQARLVEPDRCRRRAENMLRHSYRRSGHWLPVYESLTGVTELMSRTDRLAEVTEASTRALLGLIGWNGTITGSSGIAVRTGRSERLADLTASTGAGRYLYGAGGARYLDSEPFQELGIGTRRFRAPTGPQSGIWTNAARLSSIDALMTYGPAAVQTELTALAAVPLP